MRLPRVRIFKTEAATQDRNTASAERQMPTKTVILCVIAFTSHLLHKDLVDSGTFSRSSNGSRVDE